MIADAFLALVLIAGGLVLVWCAVTLRRNEQVYRYRTGLLDAIHRANVADIDAGHFDYAWRYSEFHKVSYHEMVAKFWVPLDSFYAESILLRDLEVYA